MSGMRRSFTTEESNTASGILTTANWRSAILRGIQNMPILPNQTGLYLGASSGTTVSHVSDIIGTGVVFALEFAPRSLRELIQNCDQRYNVIPIQEMPPARPIPAECSGVSGFLV